MSPAPLRVLGKAIAVLRASVAAEAFAEVVVFPAGSGCTTIVGSINIVVSVGNDEEAICVVAGAELFSVLPDAEAEVMFGLCKTRLSMLHIITLLLSLALMPPIWKSNPVLLCGPLVHQWVSVPVAS